MGAIHIFTAFIRLLLYIMLFLYMVLGMLQAVVLHQMQPAHF